MAQVAAGRRMDDGMVVRAATAAALCALGRG